MQNDTVENFEFFPWNENFNTGISIVDEQHQQLVRLLNQLATSLADLSDPIELNEIFAELAAYAELHFKTEDAVWEPCFRDDEWFVKHQQTHDSFLPEVVKLKSAEELKPIEEVLEDILKFLTDWLTHHILDSDKRMAMVIQAVNSGMTLEEAKKHAEDEMNGTMKKLIESILALNEGLSLRNLDLMKEKAEHKRVDATLNAMLDAEQGDF